MRVLLDTDVLLDIALDRKPFVQDSSEIIRWAQRDPAQAAVAWHSLSNLAYLTHPAREFIANLLEFVEVAPTGTREAKQAMGFPMADLEDALQAAAALSFDALYIVTRNVKDFKHSPVPALTPTRFLAEIGLR